MLVVANSIPILGHMYSLFNCLLACIEFLILMYKYIQIYFRLDICIIYCPHLASLTFRWCLVI